MIFECEYYNGKKYTFIDVIWVYVNDESISILTDVSYHCLNKENIKYHIVK